MDNFDEARAAAEEMFRAQSAEGAPIGNDGGEAADTSDIPPEVQAEQLPPDAIQQADQGQQEPAEPAPAADTASFERQIAQMQRDMQAMTEQNTQLQNMVRELSAKNEEHIIKDAVEMPSLNLQELTFADEDERRQAQTKYANEMREYVMAGLKNDPEMKTLLDEAERGRQEREKQSMFERFRSAPELKGFEDHLPEIENFISRNSDVFRDDAPMDIKYIIAKAVVDGVNAAAKADNKPGVDELMAIYNSNPEFRNAVEQQRLSAVKSSQQVPLMSASSGAVNAALNIPEKPKNFDDADSMVRKLFGGR